MKRTPHLLAALAAASLLITACGDDKKPASSTTSSTAVAGTTVAAGSAAPAGTTPAGGTGDASALAGGPFCTKVSEYMAASKDVGKALNADPADAAGAKAAWEKMKSLMGPLKDAAPAEVKSHVANALEAAEKMFGLIERNDFDEAKMEADKAAEAEVEAITSNTLYVQANDALKGYASDVCKL